MKETILCTSSLCTESASKVLVVYKDSLYKVCAFHGLTCHCPDRGSCKLISSLKRRSCPQLDRSDPGLTGALFFVGTPGVANLSDYQMSYFKIKI